VIPAAHHERVGGDVGQPAFVGVVRRDRGQQRGEIGMFSRDHIHGIESGRLEVALIEIGKARRPQHLGDRPDGAQPVWVGEYLDGQPVQRVAYDPGPPVGRYGDDGGVAQRDDPDPARWTE